MAFGIDRRSREEAVVAGQRIALIELREPDGLVEPDVGMVDDAGVAGLKLDAGHVLGRVTSAAESRKCERHPTRRLAVRRARAVVTTRSGVPRCHSSAKRGGGRCRGGLTFDGAARRPSAGAAAISASVSRFCPTKLPASLSAL